VDELVVLEGRHHEEGDVHPASEIALEDRVAHVPAPDLLPELPGGFDDADPHHVHTTGAGRLLEKLRERTAGSRSMPMCGGPTSHPRRSAPDRTPWAPVELAVVGNRWETGRTEAFSDGVFAIAITLLVLDIGIPASEFDDLWSAIFHEWPAYLGYATSFLTIGGIWLAHHGIFRRLRYANDPVMRINLLLLMARSCRSRPGSSPRRSGTRAPSAPPRSSTARACSRSRCCSARFGPQ